MGRPGIQREGSILRMTHLKFRWGLSHEEVEAEASGKICRGADFCHLSLMDTVPDATTSR